MEKNFSFENTTIAFSHYSDKALTRAKQVYQLVGNSYFNKIGAVAAKVALAINFPLRPFVKPLIFKQFCGGESLSESLGSIQLLQQRKVGVNLNYAVEIKKSEKAFVETFEKNLAAIDFAGRNTSVKVVSCKVSGFGHFHLLEKKQLQEPLTDREEREYDKMVKRMDELCSLAASNGTKIYWDAEESWVQLEIDRLVDDLMKKYNKEEAIVYNTYQMYLKENVDKIKNIIDISKKEKFILGAKLVRGAYMEKERDHAKERDLESPICETKEKTDISFDTGVQLCLENIENTSVCIASHNEQSNLLTTQWMEEKNIDKKHKHVWFSQLYGMGEHITFNLSTNGYNATKYMPYGPIKEVIPYLIRRANENSSVDGQIGRELAIIQKEIDRREEIA